MSRFQTNWTILDQISCRTKKQQLLAGPLQLLDVLFQIGLILRLGARTCCGIRLSALGSEGSTRIMAFAKHSNYLGDVSKIILILWKRAAGEHGRTRIHAMMNHFPTLTWKRLRINKRLSDILTTPKQEDRTGGKFHQLPLLPPSLFAPSPRGRRTLRSPPRSSSGSSRLRSRACAPPP